MKLSSDPYIILYCSSPRKRENEGSFDLTYGTWGFGLVWLFQRSSQHESAILLLAFADIAWIKLAFSFWGAYLAAELKASAHCCANADADTASRQVLVSSSFHQMHLSHIPFPALSISLKLQILEICSINK